MSTFVDALERSWEIPHFDPFNIADVKEECDVSLYELPQKLQELGELLQNTPKFAHVLWVLVKDQAKELGVDQRGFAKGLIGGDVLEKAGEAFWQEVLFFSPKQTRGLLEKAAKQATNLQAEMLQRIESQVTANLKKLCGDLPESQESTHAE